MRRPGNRSADDVGGGAWAERLAAITKRKRPSEYIGYHFTAVGTTMMTRGAPARAPVTGDRHPHGIQRACDLNINPGGEVMDGH
jgi:hypothetical protein